MPSDFEIRLIEDKDIESALEVYKPYVAETAITFDYNVPSLNEFSHKVHGIIPDYPWLVCMYKNVVAGYAYGSRHRAKTAYQWSPESTIYVSPAFQGKGVARVLYETLFSILKLQGYVNVYAGVALPNPASEKFHKAFGFYEIGVFKKVGYKLGKWHDVRWFQLHLVDIDNPPLPLSMESIKPMPEFHAIMKGANERIKAIGVSNY